jgi:hypothetical protein
LILWVLLVAQAAAQTATQPVYSLRVAMNGAPFVSLNAEGVRLPVIANDLAKQLGVRITLGPTMVNRTVSASFADASLESTLIALAPRSYIDYEIRRGVPPLVTEIYLGTDTEPEPALRGTADGLLITGHTEDTPKPFEVDPLRVMLEYDRLTVISKDQPLAIVALAIAATLNVPAEIEGAAAEMVSADLRDTPENVLLALSPNIRVDVRRDVFRGTRNVRRFAVTHSNP